MSDHSWRTPAAVIGALTLALAVLGFGYQIHVSNKQDEKAYQQGLQQQQDCASTRDKHHARIIELQKEVQDRIAYAKRLEEKASHLESKASEVQTRPPMNRFGARLRTPDELRQDAKEKRDSIGAINEEVRTKNDQIDQVKTQLANLGC